MNDIFVDEKSTGPLLSVAVFEAAKGAVVLLAGLSVVALIHHGGQHVVERLVAHLHLNPAKDNPAIFLKLVHDLANVRLWMLAAGAGAYALVRFIEAYGLWHGKRWAKWFAALSGAMYLPFELREIVSSHSGLAVAALLINGLVVALMVHELRRPKTSSE
ncbi:DUF2127 domain-containing protein [Methylobacillus sp. MM3]|uniref:DUF2127 domain-containing protein n=1 Tax=Methylobacillus sp. MM3 TaxID=1848039 RepID=UPI000AE60A36|nr:DUF2127 domain-containing protein [Methylobacillus sp. MM3]